jgi:aryl-alcohol dehydrogenase-like predicted oxidoreductase
MGLRLKSISRPRTEEDALPSEESIVELLNSALDLGIRLFDTAPAYADSEILLGEFLDGLSAERRSAITISTKFGEHWDGTAVEPYVDHSYDALSRSLDESLARLGKVDILQLHKTTEAVLGSPDLDKALAFARVAGIQKLGAVVEDVDTALLVAEDPRFDLVQFTYHFDDRSMQPALETAALAGKEIMIRNAYADGRFAVDPLAAYAVILQTRFDGAILTGTRSPQHLAFNMAALRMVLATREAADEATPKG